MLSPPRKGHWDPPGSFSEGKAPAAHLTWANCPTQWAILALAYFAAAKLGLTMAFVTEQVTAVWPPTGIALAAILVFGRRVWPGIALGAFVANATTGAPIPAAMGITVGNTLE